MSLIGKAGPSPFALFVLPSLLWNCSDKALPLLKLHLWQHWTKPLSSFLTLLSKEASKSYLTLYSRLVIGAVHVANLSLPVIPLYKLTMFQRRKITLSSFLLPPLPSPGGQHNLPHPSILGKRSFIAGKGWREGEPLQLPFSFLPGQRLFNVLGLMEQAAQHCSEGQCLAPSAGNKASFIGTQKTQLKCQLTLILFGTDTCSWDLLKPRGILSLTHLQLLGTVHCALMGIVRAIPSMCHAMCWRCWQGCRGRICWCNLSMVPTGPVGWLSCWWKAAGFWRLSMTAAHSAAGRERGGKRTKKQRRRRQEWLRPNSKNSRQELLMMLLDSLGMSRG